MHPCRTPLPIGNVSVVDPFHDEYIKGILDTDGKDNGFTISKKFWSYVRSKRRDMSGKPVLKVDGKEITTGREKAEALSKQYDSIFTNEDLTDIPCLLTPPALRIKVLTLDVNFVQKLLKNLDPKKANGPDKISTYILDAALTLWRISLRM